MALTEIVRMRLSPEDHALYSALAQAEEKDLASYLRDELASKHRTTEALVDLRRAVERSAGTSGAAAGATAQGADMGVLLEILLTLRTLAGPAKSKLVQSEVARLGFEVWKGEGDN